MTGIKIVNVTPEMVAAAHDCDLKFRRKGHWQRVPDEQVARLLSGAYELIAAQAAATERERIRQLALQVNARYTTQKMPNQTVAASLTVLTPFADLLDGAS